MVDVMEYAKEFLNVENLPSIALGALGGLVATGIVVGVKQLIEWGRPQVKVATGIVDTLLGGYLLYTQFTGKTGKPDPFLDTVRTTFGFLNLLVGLSAIASGVSGK
jgi:hypothetical protein